MLDEKDPILDFQEKRGMKSANENFTRIIMEDMAINANLSKIDMLVFSNEQIDQLKCMKIEDYKSDKNSIISQSISQFDLLRKVELVYQNNYVGMKSSTVNQYLKDIYINKRKNKVLSNMNKCYIGNRTFKFRMASVLIDLSSTDQPLDKVFRLLQVFDKGYKECQRLKLIKYKVGKEYVIFFFIYRNIRIDEEDEKNKEDFNQISGFHFFVSVKID